MKYLNLRLVLFFGAFLLVGSIRLAVAQGGFRVEVPLDQLTSKTLIDLVIANRENLDANIKFGEIRNVPEDTMSSSSISCWLWIYREVDKALFHEENRVECRWSYGAMTGVGTFSWRLPNALVTPLDGAADSLSFKIQGTEVGVMAGLLAESLPVLEKAELAQKTRRHGSEWIVLSQEGDRYPELACSEIKETCLFDFHPMKSTRLNFSLGEASVELVKILLSDKDLRPYLKISSVASITEANPKVHEASCNFMGSKPIRGQFALQADSQIQCEVRGEGQLTYSLSLDLSATKTQVWGNIFQRFDAVTLTGSVTKALYKALRAKAESQETTMMYVDDLEMINTYETVRVRRHNDQEEYPDVSLECAHVIYRDPFTELYRRRFPDVYLGRVEYYECLFKSEKD